MMADYDLVIRGGTVADGTGAGLFEADIAVKGDKIVAVGHVAGAGIQEIDAKGRLVTPGFVDIHTHYDAQVTWDRHLSPSSGHGVTTVLMGNCGVGFAPCRPDQRDIMIDVMEGVEDIPGVVMAEGLPWNWETFPDYMDAVGARSLDVDFGVQVPHTPLRVYVMGKRGINREPSTADDNRHMAALVEEGIRAGAMGFSTSRVAGHRTAGGEVIPSTTAGEDELMACALAMKRLGTGMFMTAAEFDTENGYSAEFNLLKRVAQESGRPLFFPLLQYNEAPRRWFEIAEACAQARREGANMYGQVVGRPVGVLFGLELTMNPFSGTPTYESLVHLPLVERVRALRDPAVRERLMTEEPVVRDGRFRMSRSLNLMYRMGDPPNYDPAIADRLDNVAEAAGVSMLAIALDAMLENDGKGILFFPARNYADCNLDTVFDMLRRSDTILGLGDGGAHLGAICDASMPTYMLSYWTRDRKGELLSVPEAVRMMTGDTANIVGWKDRGVVKPGYKADLNVIDYDKLRLHPPHAVYDLPAGGRRLYQTAEGYDATILSGQVTFRHGAFQEILPGRLVRGEKSIRPF